MFLKSTIIQERGNLGPYLLASLCRSMLTSFCVYVFRENSHERWGGARNIITWEVALIVTKVCV